MAKNNEKLVEAKKLAEKIMKLNGVASKVLKEWMDEYNSMEESPEEDSFSTLLKNACDKANETDKKKLQQAFPDILAVNEQDGVHMNNLDIDGKDEPLSQMPLSNQNNQVDEMGEKKKFEVIYVPFSEIPLPLQKAYNDGSLSAEEYAVRLEPFYRTTYGTGSNEDDAILSLGNDFEDKNEVVSASEKFQYVSENQIKKPKKIKK